MKKAIVFALVLTAAASFAFADEGEESLSQAQTQVQQQAQPQAQEAEKVIVKEVTLNTGASGFVTGKVAGVMPADMLTRPKSRVVIIDDAGNSNEFTVKALAVVYDSAGNFLSLNDVKRDQEVQVNYMVRSDKAKEAVAIKILK